MIEGTIRITKLPTGRLDVEALTASITINIPTAGGVLVEGISLTGSARFGLGGGLGFQLINFRVQGFAIAGLTIANAIPAPASQRRPVEADLASPFAGSNIKASDFEANGIFSDGNGVAHIDVLFKDTNFVGISAESIVDGAEEFVIGGGGAANVIVNGAGVQIDPSNPNLFRYTITKANNSLPFFSNDPNTPTRGTVEITFLASRFNDSQGASNGFDSETFFIFIPPQANPTQLAGIVPTAMLLSPFNGATVNAKTLNARPYIDVVFMTGGPGKVVGINGNEIRITGPGATNIATDAQGFIVGTPTEIAPNTWRYALTPKANVPATSLFVNGQVTVEMVAVTPNTTTPTWCVRPLVDTATTCDATTGNPGKTLANFTVDSTTLNSASSPAPTAIGPLTLDGFAIGLAGMAFKGGKLVLTIGIEANEATLAFGGAGAGGGQSSSGITAKLTGILGTFDVAVDVMAAIGAISNPAALLSAFSVTGKWGLSITSLLVDVPNVVRMTAGGLRVTYDPNYDRATRGPQQILTLQTAQIDFPRFGITGIIGPHTPVGSSTAIPGLTIWDDGFRLGRAELIYRPGQQPLSPLDANGNPLTTAPAPVTGAPTAPATIGFGGILEFNDLRVGVTNFEVRFGSAVNFNGTIYFASGGVTFLPGKPISASIVDRLACRARRHGAAEGHRGHPRRPDVRQQQGRRLPLRGRHPAADARKRAYDHRAELPHQHRRRPDRGARLVRRGRRRGEARLAGHRRRGAQLRLHRRRVVQGQERLRRLPQPRRRRRLRVQVAVLAADPDQRHRHPVDRSGQPSRGFHAAAVGQRHLDQGDPRPAVHRWHRGRQDRYRRAARRPIPIVGIDAIAVSVKGNMFGARSTARCSAGSCA